MAQTGNSKLIYEAWDRDDLVSLPPLGFKRDAKGNLVHMKSGALIVDDPWQLPYLRLRRNEKGKLEPDFDFREGLWFWAEDLHPCLTEVSMLETMVEYRAAGRLGRLTA